MSNGTGTGGTGGFTFSPMVVHLLGIAGAVVVIFATDKDFMALLPAWVAVASKPLIAVMMYLGVTQVKATP